MNSPSPTTIRHSVVVVLTVLTLLLLCVATYRNLELKNARDTLLFETLGSGSTWLTGHSLSAEQIQELQALEVKRSKNLEMQGILSGVLLLAALYVILSKKYAPTDRHWAYGMVGTIVGFWFGNAPKL